MSALAVGITLAGCGGGGSSTAGPDPGPENRAPTISGSPGTSVSIGEIYSFRPGASDPDGDLLTFSIDNRPGWASFDDVTGTLSGMPSVGDEGSYANIRISVSDGALSTSMPSFAIEVSSVSGSNNPPTISGDPPATIVAGNAYSFTPSASDPDGDTLAFSVQNRPGWASFDSATGTLSGVPTTGDVGLYNGIRITVSDGQLGASLPDFDVEVTQVATNSTTLSWTPPTLNEDGTALTDLDGYIIFYGISSGNYNNEIRIENESITTLVVENLEPGTTYYFAAKAFNEAGVESDFSGDLVRTLP